MLKDYLVKAYAYLGKVGRWELEPIEGSTKPLVPEEYRIAVSTYLVTGTIS